MSGLLPIKIGELWRASPYPVSFSDRKISRCNSPIPAITVWLVSGSTLTRNVGSSSDKDWRALESFSISCFVFRSEDFQMQLTHPRNYGLVSFWVYTDTECRVFFR